MIQFGLVLFVAWAAAQDYEDIHNSRFALHFKEIPKQFVVKGGHNKDFKKFFDEIEELARQENITVLYKVKLEEIKSSRYSRTGKKTKTKKYNIPLKKNSMKLSNFEVMLRKMAEQTARGNVLNYENVNNPSMTTEVDKRIMSTKQMQLKFKPIISRRRTNYTKFIRPVRSKIITLTGYP